ncbi:MAG: response regulator [Candidatus Rokuibacteriota bacterium]|nr:MAG: response regulator [Candidatus Rokubacteria bacterium]
MYLQLAPVHVLVVDDTPGILEVVIRMLESHGATVTAVGTAERALDLLERSRPDVLLSDLEMPVKDGYWLIGRVRALSPDLGGLTPAACLTGRSDPEDRARILRAGFQYHIAKPVEMSRLIGVVGLLALKP